METGRGTGRVRRWLLLSVWASAGFAVFSCVWGVLAGSSMIVFDGLYSFASVVLSGLGLATLRFVDRGADARFPWGREGAEPLAVLVKAAVIGGLCSYAAVGGVLDLVGGGRQVDPGWAVAYAVIATAGSAAVAVILRRAARAPDLGEAGGLEPGTDLVRAEAAEWLGDGLLSAGVLVGFLVALGLTAGGRTDLAAYVDPGMVVLTSVAFLPVPVRLVLSSVKEMLSMAAPAVDRELIEAGVAEIESRYAFEESVVRTAKVGSRIDVEIDFVLGASSTVSTVAECDVVRAEVHAMLAALGYDRSVSVTFTHDRRWTL